MGVGLALVSFFALQSPLDEASLTKQGFLKLRDSEERPTRERGRETFRRTADNALLMVSWIADSEARAKQAWQNVLSNMAGRRYGPPSLPPSGKPIGDDWLLVPGTEGGVWRIDALRGNTYVSVTLHYPGIQEDGEVRWPPRDARGDGRLVEELVRNLQTRTLRKS